MGVGSGQGSFVAFLRMGGWIDAWGFSRMKGLAWVRILDHEGKMVISGDVESPLFKRPYSPSPNI